MIQYVNQRTLPDMVSYCRYNPFGCKIASLALAYGLDVPFTGFWIQIDRTGAITAALSKLEGAAVLYAQENADTEELREFLPMAGVKLFLYSPETISIPRIESITTGWVMKLHSSKEVPKHSYLLEYNPSLRQIHSLLCACTKKGFQPPPLDLFYVDMSHRIRHHTARSAGIREEDGLSCCACTVAETSDSAVLGAVATKPSRQEKGLGRAVVSSIISQLQKEGKEVFLFRSLKENQRFYEHLGFSNFCLWEEATC